MIWIIDDDRSVRFVLGEALREAGFAVREFEDGRGVAAALDEHVPSMIYTDVRMPGIDGLTLLRSIAEKHRTLPVVVMSAYTDLASTAGAFSGGAFEFLSKPFDLDEAVAIAKRALSSESATEAPALAGTDEAAELLGQSPAMRDVFRALGRVAPTHLNVLVTGETGTGKELVARALHRHSPRANGPFVALNTAAIPADLLESELFGHEAGAFTGATRRHAGRFEQARGGTLFLDEIGDMPPALQTRLLRVLAEGEFYRVGGRELIRADVRVIAATHQPLERKVAEGGFRADLLHRLDVVRIELPPLRSRREDVPMLAQRFLARAANELGVDAKRIAGDALDLLVRHDWPGNVRELENVCRRLAVLAPGRDVTIDDIRRVLRAGPTARVTDQDWGESLRSWTEAQLAAGVDGVYDLARQTFDEVLLEAALASTNGHRQRAAARLGVGRNTITRKLGSRNKRDDR